MKKLTLITVGILMIILLVSMVSSAQDEDKKDKKPKKKNIANIETKFVTDAEKTKLENYADNTLKWKDKYGYSSLATTHYKEHNNETLMYVEITGVSNIDCAKVLNCGAVYNDNGVEKCDCNWKWRTGTQNFNEITGK
tara:strand:+ start:138 stop:551 length:414 start_codon:yes stop_codon:yes gene_type:complete